MLQKIEWKKFVFLLVKPFPFLNPFFVRQARVGFPVFEIFFLFFFPVSSSFLGQYSFAEKAIRKGTFLGNTHKCF